MQHNMQLNEQDATPRWREFWENKVTTADKHSDQKGYLKFMVGEETHESATQMHKEDVLELTRYYPDLKGKDVLELAAGIGRFTDELAKRAKHVTATDLIQDFVEENRKVNGALYSNITFMRLDAALLDYPSNTFDFVTALWLLQFLTDLQLEEFLAKMIRILRPGGYLLFRDTHYSPCGVLSRKTMGIYRTMMEYLNFYCKCSYTDIDGLSYGFDVEVYFNSKAWINLRNTPTVFNYRVKKVQLPDGSGPTTPVSHYLDSAIYNKDSLSVYEQVLDEGFAIPGGLMICEKFVKSLKGLHGEVLESLSILDVGCGFGGFGLHLLQNYKLNDVTFTEESAFACETLTLQLRDKKISKGQICLTKDMAHVPDAVCLYDCFSFITDTPDKTHLSHAKRLLKPGGVVLVGIYCSQSPGSTSDHGVNGYQSILTEDAFTEYLHELGFKDVCSTNHSIEMLQCIETSLGKLNQVNPSSTMRDMLQSKWSRQAECLRKNEISWMNFIAHS